MLIEAETIPYDAARLVGERLLVLAPHPDDEVIGCGGLVAHHLREGRAVRVVVATDGTAADGASGDREEYVRLRENESRKALALLGGAAIRFLRFPDRGLDERASAALREELEQFKPDLICVPSPIEIHPDHLALSRIFCELLQRDETLFSALAVAWVAFYEVGQPLRPNTLIDITDVAELKYRAIAAHESQSALRDYASFARGLNTYRALTLPGGMKFAEGYWVAPVSSLRTTPFSTLRRLTGAPAEIMVTRETLPVSVIIRTKDRPALLRDALDSVRANEYPASVVVVNDGGAAPELDREVKIVQHDTSRGRSEAMNSGVRAAETRFVAFLDDDDLFYPEHLATVAAAAESSPSSAAWYTNAVSAFLAIGEDGRYSTHSRLRLFGGDFDRELLLVDNYIPLPTLLTTRDAFLETKGFDPAFDLFEDWDFLVRLSQRGDFTHVPRITCEIRHFEGGSSIVLSAPEGSPRFRAAKLQVWNKHAPLIGHNTFANVFERQKQRALKLEAGLVEEKGRRAQSEIDGARLEREKSQLIAEIQALHYSINERSMHIKELEGALNVLRKEEEIANTRSEELQKVLEEAQSLARVAYAEVERLDGILNMIYRSRTWKMHALVERLKGRG